MNVHVDRISEVIRRRIGDEEEGDATRFSDDLVLDAINAALFALADYAGQVKQQAWTPTVDTPTFQLPDDLIRVLRVARTDPGSDSLSTLAETEYLAYSRPEAGEFAPEAGEGYANYDLVGSLLLIGDSVTAGQTLTVTYEGYWEEVKKNGKLELPGWAFGALPLYAIYTLLQKPGATMAVEGGWKTRRDAGKPTDNPALESASWFRIQFERICEKHIVHDVR